MFNIGNLLGMDDYDRQCFNGHNPNHLSFPNVMNSMNHSERNLQSDASDRSESRSRDGNNSSPGYCQDIDNKTLQRRQINRLRTARKRAAETAYEREIRLYKNKMRNKYRRELETLEQRAERNRRNTERNRVRRLKKKEFIDRQSVFVEDPQKTPSGVETFLKIELTSDLPRQEIKKKHNFPPDLQYTQL